MKRIPLITAALLLCFAGSAAAGFWGNDSGSPSGLDVAAGFDVNTITTVSGSVLAPPQRQGDAQHTTMTILTSQGNVTTVIGPWWYWEQHGIALAKGAEVTVTGSLAQGKDGAIYLFAQKIENRSSGETITLRSDSGKPYWSGGTGNGSGQRGGQRQGSGPRNGTRGGRR